MKIIASLLFLFSSLAAAQFQFFEQFFQGGQQAQGQQEKQNVPSDSSWYRQNWEGDVEEKVELSDGIAVCASKGGFKPGEAVRKIELARKGLI
ncbi:Long chronological lifespan protein 2 [Knufia peltigerae]|uniref:Long chronological lifespan protein 2 n=1 Tax=Knufia peltigerae TaxID=1002370 RepID=A0AA38XYZ3_9EURO|nr:Long chronological lifespan protein 2 [Knufia peltigerae]